MARRSDWISVKQAASDIGLEEELIVRFLEAGFMKSRIWDGEYLAWRRSVDDLSGRRMLSARSAAEIFGVSENVFKRWIKQNIVGAEYPYGSGIGKGIVVPPAQILAAMELLVKRSDLHKAAVGGQILAPVESVGANGKPEQSDSAGKSDS